MMSPAKKYKNIGLSLSGGFPKAYHVFNHGGVVADIGKTGGIDKFGFIDVRHENGMMFPNRWYSFVLNRDAWHMDRPMYGPAVKFISTTHDGTVFRHAPQEGRILPCGVISCQEDPDFGRNSYDLYLERNRTLRLIVGASSQIFSTFEIAICKYHISGGEYKIRQNQLIEHEYGTEMLPPEELYDSYLKGEPFRNIQGVLEWKDCSFDEKHNVLVCSGMRSFADGGRKPLFLAFGCSEKCVCTETNQNWMLKCSWSGRDKIAVSVAVGEELSELLRRISMTSEEAEERLNQMLEELEAGEKSSPEISIPAIPEASDFARIVKNAQKSITVEDSGKYAAILAASENYGYFIAWDHNYPIRDFITTGDFETAGKLLRYGIDYPHMKTVAFSVSQLILEVSELTAFEGNTDFLRENWTKLKDLFEFLKHYVDGETGMLKSCHCCGVDRPAEIGLSRYFYAACLNSWHYAAGRTMANFACLLGEEETAAEYYERAKKLEKNYPRCFFNRETGALRAAVNDDYSLPAAEVFHNSSSIGLDYPYGEFLLRNCVSGIAEYYRRKLHHPEGYSAIAYDSKSPCEMWRSVYMNQHIGHNTRVSRLNNNVKEALRVAKHYFRKFDEAGVAVETFNIDGFGSDISQWTKWQAFSATGALHCLHQSIAGISWSRGGLVYLPANDDEKITIGNFRFGGSLWHIEEEGSGEFVSSLNLNGIEVTGTMQIPEDTVGKKENRLKIVRSGIPWKKPVLLYAEDLPVKRFRETDAGFSFTVAGSGFIPLKIFARKKPLVLVNGRTVDVEFCPEESIAWADCRIKPEDKVECFAER